MIRLHCALLLALLVACGGSESSGPKASQDAGDNGNNAASDGFMFEADGRDERPLMLGRCVLKDSTEDCTGETDEAQSYVSLSDDDAMRIVVGPQGSFMLVLMLRTQGVDGGDPTVPASADNPSVEVQLRRAADDSIVTRFRGRLTFERVSAASEEFESSSAVFVVVDGQEDALIGQTVVLEAVLEDRNGERRRGLRHVRVEE
jgi:hypothetical protein